MNKEFEKEQKTISWIWSSIGKYRIVVIILCLIAAGRTVLTLLNVLYMRDLIDAAGSTDRYELIHNAVILGVIAVSQIALGVIARYVREKTSYRIMELIQQRMFGNLLCKDYVQVSSKHSAEWMNRLVLDIDGVAQAATNSLPGIVGALTHFAGAAILLLEFAPAFLVLAVIGGLAMVLFNYLMKEPIKRRQRVLRDTIGMKNIYLTENLQHLLIVKAFNREKVIADRAAGKIRQVTKKKESKMHLMLAKSGMQNFATRAAYLAVLLYCAVQIFRGNISYGSSVMLLRIMSQIGTPFTEVSTYVAGFFDVIVSVERLREVESYDDDPAGELLDDDEINRFYHEDFKDIHFTDAAFAYHDQEEVDGVIPTVFSHVDLTIPKHSCIAFTGTTGSGKSTFFKLLMSFFKLKEGSKVIRTMDGREITLDSSYRHLFAYVPQGHQLMSGTIRDMVTFGDPNAASHDDRIWEVLETACAKDFVEKLPRGLDTVIREKGAGLSEGQLQRIAVARALYTNRPILLLDEATSALDEHTERELLAHLKDMTDRTILFVTHRLNGLSICDSEVHINGNRVTLRNLYRSVKHKGLKYGQHMHISHTAGI